MSSSRIIKEIEILKEEYPEELKDLEIKISQGKFTDMENLKKGIEKSTEISNSL